GPTNKSWNSKSPPLPTPAPASRRRPLRPAHRHRPLLPAQNPTPHLTPRDRRRAASAAETDATNQRGNFRGLFLVN
uniref:Uncharacterized protein n=1 Tax=Oryza glumipatula TaxID=40148 RepID=A0A0E0AVG7_9ORYZ